MSLLPTCRPVTIGEEVIYDKPADYEEDHYSRVEEQIPPGMELCMCVCVCVWGGGAQLSPLHWVYIIGVTDNVPPFTQVYQRGVGLE